MYLGLRIVFWKISTCHVQCNAFPESCFYPLVRLDQNLPNLVPWLGFELWHWTSFLGQRSLSNNFCRFSLLFPSLVYKRRKWTEYFGKKDWITLKVHRDMNMVGPSFWNVHVLGDQSRLYHSITILCRLH